MGRVERITEAIRAHDSKLYAQFSERFGCIGIYRKTKRYETEDIEGVRFIYDVPSPHFVFALTDTWRANGKPVDWGIEPILARLKALDLWNRDLAEDLIKEYEKDAESQDRAVSNSIESFLLDFRSQFSKTFKDINTSTLSKKDSRRKEDGNCK